MTREARDMQERHDPKFRAHRTSDFEPSPAGPLGSAILRVGPPVGPPVRIIEVLARPVVFP